MTEAQKALERRKFAALGGKAAARNMTPAQRRERAQKAGWASAQARMEKHERRSPLDSTRIVISSTEWLARAIKTLKELGPMKIRPLAAAIGHPNQRRLLLLLQWVGSGATQKGNRWRIAADTKP